MNVVVIISYVCLEDVPCRFLSLGFTAIIHNDFITNYFTDRNFLWW